MLGPLEQITNKMLRRLKQMNFYQELQPCLLDRVVGGTGTLTIENEPRPRFRCRPLSQVAIAEDAGGEIMEVGLSYVLSLDQIERAYPNKVPQEFKDKYGGQKSSECKHAVLTHEIRTVEGTYRRKTVLKETKTRLAKQDTTYATLLPSRWSKIPGTPYGRGPGMRALSDTRAVNKLKELSLKNAALDVAGPYTAVDDGVINPYTVSVEPFEIIPVASNDINNPTLSPLPRPQNFDVSMFQMDELRNTIKSIFMQDQFGNQERTPRSAAEVTERTRILSQDLGASIARIQQEQIEPALEAVFLQMQSEGELPDDVELDGDDLKISFTSYLAQGQWAEEAQATMQLMELAGNYSQIDPEVGFAVEMSDALLHIGNLTGVPQRLLRSAEERKEKMKEASEGAAAMSQAAESGGEGEQGGAPVPPPGG